jgi:hypothetical protein
MHRWAFALEQAKEQLADALRKNKPERAAYWSGQIAYWTKVVQA